ncbi:MAG: hypothetical protein IPI67_16375 [Myxococcales bacterium]|nr:hypothetical protein [Myxococcales bacterium]
MNTLSWAFSDDLSPTLRALTLLIILFSVGLLLFELSRRERLGSVIVATGIAATLALGAAVLRPVRVSERGSLVGPRVVVLVDQSRRLELPAEDGRPRSEHARASLAKVRERFGDARLTFLGFGEGAPEPILDDGTGARRTTESDLASALGSLAESPGERPRAVVVVSDGRLSRPAPGSDDDAMKRAVGAIGVPVHSVRLAETGPKDASIRAIRVAGAAVAHQPLSLTIEVGCSGGLTCGDIPVAVRELRQGVEPAVLASGTAKLDEGSATLELRITLERAGARVVEISLDAPDGDQVPENDRRFITFSVARERVRLLHVAGRPTYDVRTLRQWLKSDESVDLVAFFILRGTTDDTMTDDDSELALIPFPVEELFTEHLPSFDAIVLQDIDAVVYKLDRHLPALARYVESGGGLIMVGGPSSFAGGNYAGTDLERVLPVEISEKTEPADAAEFAPRYTEAGRAAPVLSGLFQLLGEDLPTMTGSNTLGKPHGNSLVLMEHPTRKTAGAPMPVLALGEAGDGRSIALGVDGSHRLAWSELAATVSGRAFGALWDGLLGWLMRDPRFEVARAEIVGQCISGEDTTLRLTRLPSATGDVEVSVERLGKGGAPALKKKLPNPPPGPVDVPLGKLEPGGYVARVKVGQSPPARLDFACEKGGEAFADSRPDAPRLERISAVTGGRSVRADRVEELPLPAATRIAAERHVTPLLPPWVWTLFAAGLLGSHWLARRRGGLS